MGGLVVGVYASEIGEEGLPLQRTYGEARIRALVLC